MSDQYDKQAADLYKSLRYPANIHRDDICDTFAAALREQADEIERLNHIIGKALDQVVELEKIIERLKVENAGK